jgi:hypothetical protein
LKTIFFASDEQCGLKLYPDKSAVVNCNEDGSIKRLAREQFTFLDFTSQLKCAALAPRLVFPKRDESFHE